MADFLEYLKSLSQKTDSAIDKARAEDDQQKRNYEDFVQDTQTNPEKYPFVQSLTPDLSLPMTKAPIEPVVPAMPVVAEKPKLKTEKPSGNLFDALKKSDKVLGDMNKTITTGTSFQDKLISDMDEQNKLADKLPANPYEQEMDEADKFAQGLDEEKISTNLKDAQPTVDPELEAMQKRRDELLKLQLMMQGASEIGSALARTKADPNYADFLGKQADLEKTKYEETVGLRDKKAKAEKENTMFNLDVQSKQANLKKIEQEMKDDSLMADPASEISRAAKEATKQRLTKIGWSPEQLARLDGMSAKQIESMFGKMNPEYIYQSELNAQQARENAEMRRRELAERAEERKLARELDKSREDRLQDQYNRSEVKNYQFKAEDQVKKLRDIQQGADELDGLLALSETNPQAYNAIGTKLAKAMGEVGALTENDVTRYVGRKDLQGRIAKAGNDLMKGTIRQEDMQYIKEIVDVLREKSNRKVEKVYRDAASLYAKNTGVPIEKAEAYFNIQPLKSEQKQVVKKEYSASRNKTRLTYNDGSTEVVDGKK